MTSAAPFLWLLLSASAALHYDTSTAAPSCLNQSCGNITNIHYPFTLSTLCPSFNSYFQLFCDDTTQTLYMLHDVPYNGSQWMTRLPVMAISNDSLVVDYSHFAAVMKPLEEGSDSNCSQSQSTLVLLPPAPEGPYVVSDENEFGSFGCSKGTLKTSDLKKVDRLDPMILYQHYRSEDKCSVTLPDELREDGIEENASEKCGNSSEPCCLDELPPASDHVTRYVSIDVSYTDNDFDQNNPNCSCHNNYATVFYREETDFAVKSFRIKIKWALPSSYYEFNNASSFHDDPHYACDSNAHAVAVDDLRGYLCSCIEGFAGDGYANGTGCTDVNECEQSLQPCVPEAACNNTQGNYTCQCKSWHHVGDGRWDGTGCKLSPPIFKALVSISSIFGSFLLVGVLTIIITHWMKRNLKQRNFVLNGGLELQKSLKEDGTDKITRIFSEMELQIATNNYADEMKIAIGGFGAVYKGKLVDSQIVAIKKSISEHGDRAQFLNEIAILTKIHHTHIVRLLGCCLETNIPLLVYEFILNGTLAENLERNDGSIMRWDHRLRIAVQTSEALTYLHRYASPHILHRDVKSTNVLLDENWNVKLVDFGVSRHVPDGIDHISNVVKGTLGYLDPEYFQTLHLTDKIDVYSFGVMLVELITTLKPIDYQREPQYSNLALLFIHHINEGSLEQIIDHRLEIDYNQISLHDTDWAWKTKSSILSVASLAHRCLAQLGRDRPSMVEVEHELHQISQILNTTIMYYV